MNSNEVAWQKSTSFRETCLLKIQYHTVRKGIKKKKRKVPILLRNSLNQILIILAAKKRTHTIKLKTVINTCLWPLEPRWGVAKVIKFMGSSPAILPLNFSCGNESLDSSLLHSPFSWEVLCVITLSYSLAIAYLAIRPPSEWPIKDIFLTYG